MKRKILSITAGFGALLMTSCTMTMPLTATNNAIGTKEGKVSNNCLFSFIPLSRLGNGELMLVSGGICFNNNGYDIYKAAEAGNIGKVATVDLKVTNYVFFQKYDLIVTGD